MSSEGTAASQRELDAEDLRTRLQDFQYRRWMYEQNHGEFWSGLFDGPPILPAAQLLAGCKLLTSRLDIIKDLPRGGKFAEVGTLFGDFIVEVIEINQPDDVHIFDLDFSKFRAENTERIKAHGSVTFHVGDSSSELAKFDGDEQDAFDVIYIDGDHRYEGVWKDLTAALRILKPAGYLVVNDYTTWDPISCCPYGVFSAVNRFATENNLYFTHLALEPYGYHDVALRRKS